MLAKLLPGLCNERNRSRDFLTRSRPPISANLGSGAYSKRKLFLSIRSRRHAPPPFLLFQSSFLLRSTVKYIHIKHCRVINLSVLEATYSNLGGRCFPMASCFRTRKVCRWLRWRIILFYRHPRRHCGRYLYSRKHDTREVIRGHVEHQRQQSVRSYNQLTTGGTMVYVQTKLAY
jgi:hypothetical protein